MVHGPHEGQPGYHPDQILHDGCDECEHRGRNLPACFNAMDKGRFEAAWNRAAAWNRGTVSGATVSDAEADLLMVLWCIQIKLENRGVPIGKCPAAPVVTQAAIDAARNAAPSFGPTSAARALAAAAPWMLPE